MEWSEQIGELAAALAKAQGAMKAAVKDATNPHFGSRYADLASVWEACRAPLSTAQLAVIQQTRMGPEGMELVTTLAHSSGQWVRSSIPVRAARPDPQSVGSALTYARRYALAAMVGVAPDDDDDGQEGSTPAGKTRDQAPHEAARQQSQRRPAQENGRRERKGNGTSKPPLSGEAWAKRINSLRSMEELAPLWREFVQAVPAESPLRKSLAPTWEKTKERLMHDESVSRRPTPQRAGD